jgi:hypothetical protein
MGAPYIYDISHLRVNLSATYVVIDAVNRAGESVCLANRVRAFCFSVQLYCKCVHR